MDQEVTYDCLVNSVHVTKNRPLFIAVKNAKIRKAQISLCTGIYSLKEFLELFHKENLHKQCKMALLAGDYILFFPFL